MHLVRTLSMRLLILLLAAALMLLMACGEDVVEASNDGGENGSAQVNNEKEEQENKEETGPTGPDDCEEDELYNPVTGQCQPAAGETNQEPGATNQEPGDNQTEPQECEGDQVVDPSTGECVEPGEIEECGPGALVGTSCRTDGAVLPSSTVSLEGVDCEGQFFSVSTTADAQGEYSFEDIPAGRHELQIVSGSFSNVAQVDIYRGETTDLTSDNAKVCVGQADVTIGILQGTFDDIGGILTPLGIDYDVITDAGATFGDLNNLNQYDIIFVECINNLSSLTNNPFQADLDDLASNIRTFVESGNSLYVSDYSHSFVSEAFPEIATYRQPNPNVGYGNQTTTAQVVSADMQALLGTSTTDIYFNTAWSVVDSVGPMTTVHFQGDVQTSQGMLEDRPLMFSYDDLVGQGRVIYTSFHNQEDLQENMQEILEFVIFQL